ncbi:MAG: hypothetical protein KDA89_00570 [Planctomycetaceae bacterium]|nr:hypothetical protein [Planctomycetaceae bacterium]
MSDQRAPLAVDTKEAARLCSISERHFLKLDEDDRLGPRSLRLGTCVQWNVAELTAWLNAGCPHREQWEAMREERLTTVE